MKNLTGHRGRRPHLANGQIKLEADHAEMVHIVASWDLKPPVQIETKYPRPWRQAAQSLLV